MPEFANRLPLTIHCSFCHVKQMVDGKWIPLDPSAPVSSAHAIIAYCCDECEQKWATEERSVSIALENERRLSLPKLVKSR